MIADQSITTTWDMVKILGSSASDGDSGYVQLAEEVQSGVGTGAGTYFYSSGNSFFVHVIGKMQYAGATFRVILGASSTGTDPDRQRHRLGVHQRRNAHHRA